MDTTFRPQSLQEAVIYFSNPEVAFRETVRLRWPDGVVKCPTCGSEKVKFLADRRVWQCSDRTHAKHQFSVKVGSIMEDSALGLDKWLIAMWLIGNARNGISSYELARDLKIGQKAAWFVLHRIRLAMQGEDGGKLNGEVEVDETYIGGKARNMHPVKRQRVLAGHKGGHAGKTIVMGFLQRIGERGHSAVRTKVVRGVRREHVIPPVVENVEKLATVYTDALPSYEKLPENYLHHVINHAEKYAEGTVHVNGLENFWSLLKRTIGGTYVSVEPFHLFRYLDEQAFRFNTRKLTDGARFGIVASSIFGKRLTFDKLTAADSRL